MSSVHILLYSCPYMLLHFLSLCYLHGSPLDIHLCLVPCSCHSCMCHQHSTNQPYRSRILSRQQADTDQQNIRNYSRPIVPLGSCLRYNSRQIYRQGLQQFLYQTQPNLRMYNQLFRKCSEQLCIRNQSPRFLLFSQLCCHQHNNMLRYNCLQSTVQPLCMNLHISPTNYYHTLLL